MKKTLQNGFTLVETMIYIALFTVIVTAGFVSAYSLIDSAGKLNTKTSVEEEGNFVLRKMDWIFSGISTTTPIIIGGAGCNQNVTVVKINYPYNPVVLRLNLSGGVNYIEIKKASGPYIPLTTANVSVSCLKFDFIPASLGSPSGITATTTINGIDFATTKYARN